MILFVREKESVREYCASDGKCGFTVLGHPCFASEENGSWKLDLPPNLKSDPDFVPAARNIVRLNDTGKSETAYLILLAGEENWKDYDCWTMPDRPFSIGSSPKDEIFYFHDLLEEGCWKIDPLARTVYTETGDTLFVNSHACAAPYHYQYGDLIEIYGLKAVLLQECIMINRMAGVSVRLQPYTAKENSQRNHSAKKLRYERIPFVMPPDTMNIKLDAPQSVAKAAKSSLFLSIGPSLMMAFASLGSGAIAFWNGYEKGREIIEMVPSLLFPVMMLVSAVLWTPLQRFAEKRRHRQEIRERNEDYRSYLRRVLDSIDQFVTNYQNSLETVFYDAVKTYQVCLESDTLRIPDCDHVYLRLGSSREILKINIIEKEGIRNDAAAEEEISKFREEALKPHEVPYILDLSAYKKIAVSGADSAFIEMMIIQTALRTHPDETGIAVFLSREQAEEWGWLSDLPHIYSDDGRRMIAFTEEDAQELCDLCVNESRDIILFNLLNRRFNESEFMSQICFTGTNDLKCDLRISVCGDECTVSDFTAGSEMTFIKDQSEVSLAKTACRLPARTQSRRQGRSFSFLEMHGCKNVDELQIEKRWKTSNISKGIRSLIGCNDAGEDIILDLYEKKDGPHGLIAGTTGSGKSELILTMILSLAVNYPPKDLQFILIDFKGGSSMNSLSEGDNVLPHITGTLTNLDNDDMQRVIVQFSIECRKREELMKKLSSLCNEPVMNASDYRRFWKAEYGLEWIAELVIIVDEFAQLKTEQPEFLSELISIARVGRALGIHLILATQKPAGVVTDQIWSNARFKICLKVSETQDSMEMLKRKDAAYIREPGVFWLMADERYETGRSGYVQSKNRIVDTSVVIYDLNGRIARDSSVLQSETETEIKQVIRRIVEIQKTQQPVEPLWKPVLVSIAYEDLKAPWSFALIDDYHHNAYVDLILEREAVHAFVTNDVYEKRNLTRVLIHTILHNAEADDEIIVIDDIRALENGNFTSSPMITDVCTSVHEETCDSLYQLLSKRTDHDSHLFLMINDLSTHYELNPDAHDLLMKCAAKCQEKNMTMILIANNASSFSYRDLALLNHRYVIHGASQQDIQGFLETVEKTGISRASHGLKTGKPLKEFCLYECGEKDLEAAVRESMKKKRTKEKHTLLHMPETVRLKDCHSSGIPLGIIKKNCRWLSVHKEKVCVIGEDSEQLAAFEELYKRTGVTFDHEFPSESQMCAVLTDQARDFDAPKYKDTVFLFLYDAFAMQYRVNRKVRKKENESVLFYKNRTEVIRIAEE